MIYVPGYYNTIVSNLNLNSDRLKHILKWFVWGYFFLNFYPISFNSFGNHPLRRCILKVFLITLEILELFLKFYFLIWLISRFSVFCLALFIYFINFWRFWSFFWIEQIEMLCIMGFFSYQNFFYNSYEIFWKFFKIIAKEVRNMYLKFYGKRMIKHF